MKTPFQVGDRVAVYSDYNTFKYFGGPRQLGKVFLDHGGDMIEVEITGATSQGLERYNAIFTVHRKQCRRLKPKKKKAREWHVTEHQYIGRESKSGNGRFVYRVGIIGPSFEGTPPACFKEVLPTKPKVKNAFSGKTNLEVREMLGGAWNVNLASVGVVVDDAPASYTFKKICKDLGLDKEGA